jgi:hypothetical protein
MNRSRVIRAFALSCLLGAGFAASVAIGSASTGATTASTTTTVAAPSNASVPGVSGSTQDGRVLSTSKGAWTGSPTSFAFAWLRCDGDGGGCVAIAGANSFRYTISSADVGHRLRSEVTASNAGGSGSATSGATGVVRATGNAPANTKAPTLSGTAQLGSSLTVNSGTWSGTAPISYDYTWQRCLDPSGVNCVTFVAHQNVTSYTLGSADLNHRLRVEVQATNARGSSYVFTSATGVVGQKPTETTVAGVSLPDRLVIDQVSFSPNPVTSRTTPITARFHVSDTNGLSVQGALVYAIGLPYGWAYNAAEQQTDSTGWATLTIQPTRNMPLRRGALVMFVRARKPGDNLLAGVSTRRLVQESIG